MQRSTKWKKKIGFVIYQPAGGKKARQGRPLGPHAPGREWEEGNRRKRKEKKRKKRKK